MPELPEVVTIKNQLSRKIIGKVIRKVDVKVPKMVNLSVSKFKCTLKGRKIINIERKAKALIFKLDKGNLLVHMKMTGQLVFLKNKKNLSKWKYTHIIFYFKDRSLLLFNDLRKFGYIKYFEDKELGKEIEKMKLGIEPLSKEFTFKKFKELLKIKPKSKIKLFLMDNKMIVGIGNIYANEILFRAGIRPTRLVKSLKETEIKKLYKAIIVILKKAIKHKGSSVDQYLDALGQAGTFGKLHKVYGKKGQKCPRCNGKIIRISLGQRGTFYCPKCQV